jgi:hypothetical protein
MTIYKDSSSTGRQQTKEEENKAWSQRTEREEALKLF